MLLTPRRTVFFELAPLTGKIQSWVNAVCVCCDAPLMDTATAPKIITPARTNSSPWRKVRRSITHLEAGLSCPRLRLRATPLAPSVMPPKHTAHEFVRKPNGVKLSTSPLKITMIRLRPRLKTTRSGIPRDPLGNKALDNA